MRERILGITDEDENFSKEPDQQHSDLTSIYFAAHIAEQNQIRSEYFKSLELGDPIWDILLDIYVSENADRPTTLEAIADRQDRPQALCTRCINYLLEREAIFENRNQYTASKFRFLASDKTKQEMSAWLNNCLTNAPQI